MAWARTGIAGQIGERWDQPRCRALGCESIAAGAKNITLAASREGEREREQRYQKRFAPEAFSRRAPIQDESLTTVYH